MRIRSTPPDPGEQIDFHLLDRLLWSPLSFDFSYVSKNSDPPLPPRGEGQSQHIEGSVLACLASNRFNFTIPLVTSTYGVPISQLPLFV
jgi:hypothetical protein